MNQGEVVLLENVRFDVREEKNDPEMARELASLAEIYVNDAIEFPTSYPCALKKVYAIAPPIINVSTFSSKLFITPILSETFFPPKIATNGLLGFSKAFPIKSSSFSIKKPETAGKVKYNEIPTGWEGFEILRSTS